jgi:hypothetical protein
VFEAGGGVYIAQGTTLLDPLAKTYIFNVESYEIVDGNLHIKNIHYPSASEVLDSIMAKPV